MKFRNLLIPTEHNDYTPHILQRVAVVGFFLLILLSFAATNLQALFWQSSNWLVGTVLPAVIVDLTNEERTGLSERPLLRNAALDRAAQLKAEDMAKNHYFAHYSPTGVTPWHWFDAVSYQYVHAGENLAIHFSDSEDVVDAWMNSPLHKENIIDPNYTEIGVGTAKGTFDGFDTVFVVQLFGTPAATLQPQAPLNTLPPPVVEVPRTEIVAVNEEILPVTLAESNVEKGLVEGESADMISELELEVEGFRQSADAVEPLTEEITAVESKNTSYSSFIATTSNLLPASLEDVSGTTAIKAPVIGSLATKPNSLLQGLYLIVGLILASILISSIILGAKHHRPMQVAYGIGLMLLMSGLFYVHVLLTTSVVIASTGDTDGSISVLYE